MFCRGLIVMLMIMALVLGGCRAEIATEDILSPEETVEEYFKHWIAKDNEMMNSFVTERKKAVVYELDRMTFLELDSIELGDDRCGWNDAWYEGQYEYTCVNVTFTIEFLDGHGAGFSNGTYVWQYYLVRDSEESEWLIVMWGVL